MKKFLITTKELVSVICKYIIECDSYDEVDTLDYDDFQDGFQEEERLDVEDYNIIDLQEIN